MVAMDLAHHREIRIVDDTVMRPNQNDINHGKNNGNLPHM